MTILTLYAALASVAIADDGKISFDPVVGLWVSHDQTSAFPVDAEGTLGGQNAHLELRHKLGATFSTDDVAVNVLIGGQADQIWGSGWNVPGDIDERNRHQNKFQTPQLRKLSIQADLEYFQFELGLTTSHWGMGILANNGEMEPFFGQPEFGDRVVRARATTRAGVDSPWFFSLAWDRVIQDDLVYDPNTQWATQVLGSVVWTENDDTVGINGVYRTQDERIELRKTRVTALDVYAEVNAPISESVSLHTAVEVAGMTGKTDRALTYQSPDSLHILGLGASAYGMLGFLDDSFKVGLSTGYASGDGNPNDDTLHDFTFDRNFDVGMVLFDEVLSGIDAAQYRLATHPQYSGQPPDGIDASVYEGSFRRATYLQPRLEYKPIPHIRIRAGVVMAWATAPIAHGFYTVRNGGTPVNHLKQRTKGYRLGTEYDWSVQFQPFTDHESFFYNTRVSIQGGHAQLDSNLGGDAMGRIDRYILMFHVL